MSCDRIELSNQTCGMNGQDDKQNIFDSFSEQISQTIVSVYIALGWALSSDTMVALSDRLGHLKSGQDRDSEAYDGIAIDCVFQSY